VSEASSVICIGHGDATVEQIRTKYIRHENLQRLKIIEDDLNKELGHRKDGR